MEEKIAIGVFDVHDTTQGVIRSLKEAGIKDDHLSLVAPAGKIQASEQHIIQGFHATSHRIREGAKWGGWIGGVAGILAGAGVFFVTAATGPVVAVGALATIIAGGIEGAVIGAGTGVLATSLASLGIKDPDAKELEKRVANGEFLVIVKGPEELTQRAEVIFKTYNALSVMAA